MAAPPPPAKHTLRTSLGRLGIWGVSNPVSWAKAEIKSTKVMLPASRAARRRVAPFLKCYFKKVSSVCQRASSTPEAFSAKQLVFGLRCWPSHWLEHQRSAHSWEVGTTTDGVTYLSHISLSYTTWNLSAGIDGQEVCVGGQQAYHPSPPCWSITVHLGVVDLKDLRFHP